MLLLSGSCEECLVSKSGEEAEFYIMINVAQTEVNRGRDDIKSQER